MSWSFRLVGHMLALSLSAVAGCRTPPAEKASATENAAASSAEANPEASMPQQIAEVMSQLNGGIHPGFRFAHAKGVVLTGTFTPAKGATSLSRAAHLKALIQSIEETKRDLESYTNATTASAH